jgi:phosphoribosylformylglycinamidine cyclo-ligase
MPGFYPQGRYDLAGFCVAVVEEEELINGSGIEAGDQLLAVASSGVHSNGFSLVRRVLSDADIDLHQPQPHLDGLTAADALLLPTLLYAPLLQLLRQRAIPVRGMAHITGGGLPENMPRCLPEGLQARVNTQSWQRPALFQWLQELGQISERDMWHTFNLGVGFVLAVEPAMADHGLSCIAAAGFHGWRMGLVEKGQDGVVGLPDGA